MVLASEAGVLPAEAKDIRMKGRLQPGRMFLVDTVQGRIIDDEEIKADIVGRKPYRSWVTQHGVSLDELPEPLNVPQPDHPTIRQRQQAFGYTVEELKMVLTPMIVTGEEAVSSMGTDTPLAVLSDRPQLLFKYFKQLFAQVTNPPIDPIREQLVMSLVTNIGPKPNLMEESPESCRRIKVQQPILTNADLQKIRGISDPHFKSKTLRMLFRIAEGPDAGLGGDAQGGADLDGIQPQVVAGLVDAGNGVQVADAQVRAAHHQGLVFKPRHQPPAPSIGHDVGALDDAASHAGLGGRALAAPGGDQVVQRFA